MAHPGALDGAIRRLTLALDALDAAAERRREADRAEASLARQVQALGIDRSALAVSLDEETARVRALQHAHREVGRRVDIALETIRTVIEANDR